MNDFEWVDNIKPPLTSDNIRIGMSVVISEGCEYYLFGMDGDVSNPINTVGLIVNFDTCRLLDDSDILPISVEWANGEINSYCSTDLKIIKL